MQNADQQRAAQPAPSAGTAVAGTACTRASINATAIPPEVSSVVAAQTHTSCPAGYMPYNAAAALAALDGAEAGAAAAGAAGKLGGVGVMGAANGPGAGGGTTGAVPPLVNTHSRAELSASGRPL